MPTPNVTPISPAAVTRDGRPVFTINSFDQAAMLFARMAIAKAMGAETLAFQGFVLSLEYAQRIGEVIKAKIGWQ